jgi:hypothetical protein
MKGGVKLSGATVILVLGMASTAAPCRAQSLTNGSFEQGGGSFTGWGTIGNTAIANITSTQPSNGSSQAFISNSSGNSVAANALSAFFNNTSLPPNAKGGATNGSGILQTFTVAAPITLSFDFQSVTAESLGSLWDTSFFYLDGNLTILPNPDELNAAVANTNTITVGSESYSFNYSYKTLSFQLTTGSHTIGFGVYNTGDTSVNTGLFVDNIRLGAVPEPDTIVLLATGLVGVAAVGWRRRRVNR